MSVAGRVDLAAGVVFGDFFRHPGRHVLISRPSWKWRLIGLRSGRGQAEARAIAIKEAVAFQVQKAMETEKHQQSGDGAPDEDESGGIGSVLGPRKRLGDPTNLT